MEFIVEDFVIGEKLHDKFRENLFPTLEEELAIAEKESFPFIGGLYPINFPLCYFLYGFYFANWPVFSRRTAEFLGEPFGDEFPHHYGDGDLALFIDHA